MIVLKRQATIADGVAWLETKGIGCGLSIEGHATCNLMSSCKVAIQLRHLLKEHDIPIPGELEISRPREFAFDEIEMRLNEANLTPKLSIVIGSESKVVDIPLGDGMKRSLGNWCNYLRGVEAGLYRALLSAYINAKNSRETAPPALPLILGDAHRYNIIQGSIGHDYYISLPFKYAPKEIFSGDKRYSIREPGQLERDVRIVFSIRSIRDKLSIVSIRLYTTELKAFSHYHGDGTSDCWGEATHLPLAWMAGDWSSLIRLRDSLQIALHTINKRSLMTHTPSGFPNVDELLAEAVKLGEEGRLNGKESKKWGEA